MNKLTYLLPVIFLYLTSCGQSGIELSVYNAGEERIDSLHISAGKRNYLIEDLEPQKIKNIRILIIGDDSLVVKADDHEPIIVKERFMSHKPTVRMQIGINKDKMEFASSSNS